MVERINVGEARYLPNNAVLEAKVIDPLNMDPNPGSAAIAEARHVILNPNNVKKASIDNEGGGVTEIISFDSIQFAAHKGDGDGHDRKVSEMMGEDYDGNAQTANSILAGKKKEQRYVAGFLQSEREASGSRLKNVIQRATDGEQVEVLLTDEDGGVESLRLEGVTNEVVVVDFGNSQQKAA